MKDRNISVIAKSPPSREVSRSDGGCDFEVLSKISLAERLHPPPDISRAGSPLRGTPLKGRGSEMPLVPDSSEVRSGHQPPLALTALPLLKKEGRKNYVAVGACPDAYWSSTTLSAMTIDFSEESIFKNNSTTPTLTACPLLKKEGSNNSPLLRGVDSPKAKTGCVKSPPSREVSRSDGGCDFEVLSTIILAERLHPSPLRGTPLKGRGSEVRSESDSSEVRSGQALTRTFNTIITDNIY